MSPRTPEPEVRQRLIEAAARLLADQGPSGLSTRKLAAEVGASTMAVYTHFGGLPELVRAVVREGFTRLADHLRAVPETDDPLLDLAALGEAYRANALDNPHLYAVMFGTASLGGYRLHDDELDEGRYTFDMLVAATRRTIDAGIFRPGDPEAIAGQLWSAVHGYVMLELAGYLAADREPDAVEKVLNPMLTGIITALVA
ncbi:MAG TPA: TetR/AcrR family transcriptional regulator [Mycobacteriales bacterium]|nr:TetR/AcrR family transcriptional regulator [Mycobacteriales bacterium]